MSLAFQSAQPVQEAEIADLLEVRVDGVDITRLGLRGERLSSRCGAVARKRGCPRRARQVPRLLRNGRPSASVSNV